MPDQLDTLVESLLYEGYALYPYTPGATKNATPTPFGIAYPPAYAETLPSTFDHLALRAVLDAPPDAVLSAEVRFLAAAGDRHEARAHRLTLQGAMVGALAASPRAQGGPDRLRRGDAAADPRPRALGPRARWTRLRSDLPRRELHAGQQWP